MQHDGYTETLHFKDRLCTRCPETHGPSKGVKRRELRLTVQAHGPVPDALIGKLKDGQWRPKWPESARIHDEIEELVQNGVVEADFKIHSNGNEVVAWVHAPHAEQENEVSRLRRELYAMAPQAEDWSRRATRKALQVALRIAKTPNHQALNWPPRIWNALFSAHSKAGDISRIASALGAKPNTRLSAHAIWFYGHGTMKAAGRTLVIEGELVVPEQWLRGQVQFLDVERLGIVENRDLASIAPGLVLALDGPCSSTHLNVIAEANRQGLPAWVWTDMDGAGINMTRNVRKAHPGAFIVGFATWPTDWALAASADQQQQARDAAKTSDELTLHAHYVLRNGWFEQERIFAELMLQGKTWNDLLEGDAD